MWIKQDIFIVDSIELFEWEVNKFISLVLDYFRCFLRSCCCLWFFWCMLSCSQLIEECSDCKKVDKLETCNDWESKKQAKKSTESSKNSKPILVHILAIFSRCKIDEVDMDKWVVGEIDVLEEAQCIVREITVDRSCRCFAWVTGNIFHSFR